MLISRTLARKRIAAGERPSRRGAWLPVLADTIIIGLVLAALWQPALTFIYVMQFSLIWTILFLMLVIYVPAQIVIIISSMWAVKSRWEDEKGPE
ncbi:hypothetical protein CLV80_106192 [Yoonia maritima]|uniref:Uncharacterized protein n=1 Tax=Yoonia maritima TaxID=1435347 RepID=A0A2T0VYK8_9RHOB|nr:hypothetical protein [Yoonia maritima]PRY77347.1 hypothetical protein CLV80_106192 [Yoonia maritima]